MARTEVSSFIRPLQLGSKPSDTSMRTSSIKEGLYWKSKETSVKKVNPSLLGKSTTVRTKDGSTNTTRIMDLTYIGK
jgi:hypothetical protein